MPDFLGLPVFEAGNVGVAEGGRPLVERLDERRLGLGRCLLFSRLPCSVRPFPNAKRRLEPLLSSSGGSGSAQHQQHDADGSEKETHHLGWVQPLLEHYAGQQHGPTGV